MEPVVVEKVKKILASHLDRDVFPGILEIFGDMLAFSFNVEKIDGDFVVIPVSRIVESKSQHFLILGNCHCHAVSSRKILELLLETRDIQSNTNWTIKVIAGKNLFFKEEKQSHNTRTVECFAQDTTFRNLITTDKDQE